MTNFLIWIFYCALQKNLKARSTRRSIWKFIVDIIKIFSKCRMQEPCSLCAVHIGQIYLLAKKNRPHMLEWIVLLSPVNHNKITLIIIKWWRFERICFSPSRVSHFQDMSQKSRKAGPICYGCDFLYFIT